MDPIIFGHTEGNEKEWLIKFYAWPLEDMNVDSYALAMSIVQQLWDRLAALYPEETAGVIKWSIQ